MSDLVIMRASNDSDCNSNSNLRGSCFSTISSHDVDFIQDCSDYQWFLDYGYRDGGMNHYTSILTLPEKYGTDNNYYDILAKNMDANLAEADMESFKTEDIHALLTNFPPMCTDHLSQEASRQGECYADLSSSMVEKYDLDSFTSPQSSSQGDDCSANSVSMSICQSEILFSPIKETPILGANFSVDSLDCDLYDLMLTCQGNKDNYTIAFEGSVTTYSENSDNYERGKCTPNSPLKTLNKEKKYRNNMNHGILEGSLTQSESSSLITWSKLKSRKSDDNLTRPPGNNNNSDHESSKYLILSDTAIKSQSMPNLHKQKLHTVIEKEDDSSSHSSPHITVKRRLVKVFDIHHHVQSSSESSSCSDMATSVDISSYEGATKIHPNFSLVKLFVKQKSMSQEGMSLTLDLHSCENSTGAQSGNSSLSDDKRNNVGLINSLIKLSDPHDEKNIFRKSDQLTAIEDIQAINDNNNDSMQEETRTKTVDPEHFIKPNKDALDISIQTSQFSEISNLKKAINSSGVNINKPLKLIEPSFLKKLRKEGEIPESVYILYPNYVLPDLAFLNEKPAFETLLMPQDAPRLPIVDKIRPFSLNDIELLKRHGFNHVKDWDSLKVLLPREYRHILTEVPEMTCDIKGAKNSATLSSRLKKRHFGCEIIRNNLSSTSSIGTQPSSGYRGSSSILTESQNTPGLQINNNPLFVYQYDSVTSSEASLQSNGKVSHYTTTRPQYATRCVNFPHHENITSRKILRQAELNKRCVVCETTTENLPVDEVRYKRKSVPEPHFFRTSKIFSETEDEGVDAGTSSSSFNENEDASNGIESFLPRMNTEELMQLEEYLKLVGISLLEGENTNDSFTQLKCHVNKFLALKINQDKKEQGEKKTECFDEKGTEMQITSIPPNNSPNVSAFLPQHNFQSKRVSQMAISEENENNSSYCGPPATPKHLLKTVSDYCISKRLLINEVQDAVKQIMEHFSPASNQQELNRLGDSSINPACAKLVLSRLCPTLYAIFSDGLKPCLETSFGAINNSVWQVIEASSQQGPLTKALHDLVMRINGEDVINEGLVKFNAFIFGLLNVRSLDAWINYLRTRESILKKHYSVDSLMVLSYTGGTNLRGIIDSMVSALQPIAFIPFQLDILFESKQLHQSFKNLDSLHKQISPTRKYSPNYIQFIPATYVLSPDYSKSELNQESTSKSIETTNVKVDSSPMCLFSPESCSTLKRIDKVRPRSYIEHGSYAISPNFKIGEDVTKKRWSGIETNSKVHKVYDRLIHDDEEYADSLEPPQSSLKGTENNDSKQAYLVSNDQNDPNSSNENPLIGRRFKKLQQKWEMLSGKNLIETDSPPPSPSHVITKSKIPRPIASPIRPPGSTLSSRANNKIPTISEVNKHTIKAATKKNASRTSRVDQVGSNHVQRPSSLPYKPNDQNNRFSKNISQRRAASTSLNRRTFNARDLTPKAVRTLSHRLPSESGHLSYNEGEILNVILEVDDKWLLCCRGKQKGLVPKSSVIADNDSL